MATQGTEGAPGIRTDRKPSLRERLRTALLILFVATLTIFCVKNLATVRVWPIGQAPLFVVIAICVALGAGIGWIGHSMMGGRSRSGG